MDTSSAQSIGVSWFLHNACTSNVQLAVVSNVCRRWREIASRTIAAEAVALAVGHAGSAPPPEPELSAGEGAGSTATEHESKTSLAKPSLSSSTRRLLITDMARELIVRHHQDNQKQSCSDATIAPGKNGRHVNTDGSFCLAWFAPSGIQTTSVSLDDRDVEEESSQFGCSGNGNGNGRRGRKLNSGRNVICCSEWRGYRDATEVLIPFGYATHFITSVLDAASERGVGTTPPPEKSCLSSTALSSSSFSVRGATLARPEGFCLCIDDEYVAYANSSQFEKPAHAASHCVTSCIDEWMNGHEPSGLPLHKKTGLSLSQRRQKRRNLAQALLPRVIMSARRKYPLLHRFAEDGADIQAPPRPLPWEQRQRAVQFLNSDRSQAVKLITPKFECPTRGPVTMFVVAITTEDGCFLSGRSERFEFGHLYSLSPRDMSFDMANISIATGKREETASAAAGVPRGRRASLGSDKSSSDENHESSDSELSVHCLCDFDSGDPFNPNDIEIDDPHEECIHRGVTGPGLWHCYVAVFDGKDSVIRVDGAQEPKLTRENYGLPGSDEDGDDADKPANAGRFVGSGVLDGLSIGSDHQFDMSLCYGEIEGECGQGAIAEIAVFKGAMEEPDIEKLEKHLMQKHGLLSVREKKEFFAKEKEKSTRTKPLKIGSHLQEDEWRRQAHALIKQQRPWKIEGAAVPLRAAANHPSLAWQRTNEITGAPVRISRIGAKRSNGSSDW